MMPGSDSRPPRSPIITSFALSTAQGRRNEMNMSTHSTLERPLEHRSLTHRVAADRAADARTATERADRRIGRAVAGVAASGMVVSFACAILAAVGAIH